MTEKTLYQTIRTVVKKDVLRPIVGGLGMEYAIRASTPQSVEDTESALRASLRERGFHVIHETDVKAVHNHYKLDYPAYKILKVVKAQTFYECPMVNAAITIDPDTGVFLPPSIVVYDLDGETRVSAIRPSTLLALFNDSDVRATVRELEGVLWDALAEGVPESTMLSEEPPVAPGQEERRARLKQALYPVLNLLDAEFSIHVSTDRPREEVTRSLRQALRQRGQHVLGEVGGGDVLLVVNPGQAHKALAIDPDVGVFAPLSVTIHEEDGRTHVRCVRPSTLLIFFAHPEMQAILMEMELLLWNSLVVGVPDAKIHSRQPPLPPGTGQRTTAGGLPGGLGSIKKYYPD
ncbi:DUF302 domain-containing protein [Haloferax sp. S1W]|uniref:DUF302 domain-containing protein n=1 Tax=Haloferax sp. S1W TaxID=3377110 RepID=UPI0037C50373